jgi:hypothetical protein
MRTTVELPDDLYRAAKIRAVEKGTPFKEILIQALEHELQPDQAVKEPSAPYWAKRKLSPEFQQQLRSHIEQSGKQSTEIISEDRDSRDASLL